jgi:hypothetical protein
MQNDQEKSLDSRERVHLEWMFENQPELVRQLHHQGKLRQHLENQNQAALRLVDKLKSEAGMTEEEAFQAAMESVLAPADGPAMTQDPAPEPVPLREQEQVLRALE